jgi:hypothetical protein
MPGTVPNFHIQALKGLTFARTEAEAGPIFHMQAVKGLTFAKTEAGDWTYLPGTQLLKE